MGRKATFQIHVKNEHSTLPSTQNTFSVLLDSIRHVSTLITNCDKSQIATARIPELSQFVTLAICDGSEYNFSGWCQKYPRVYSQVQKTCHINIGPFQGDFLGTSIMDIWLIYIKTRRPVKYHQNGQKCKFSYSCQKWTCGISQVHRTCFQCYWTQFVPSRPWSQIAPNHKLRRQGFLICRILWLS